MRVFFSHLGCKLNQAEVEQLARGFRGAGHELVGSLSEAELHVVNTCTVTHAAARDSRKLARRGRRINPSVRTVITGCFVDAEPEEAARLAGVDLVIPNAQKDRLMEKVHAAFPEAPPRRSALRPGPPASRRSARARALVKIEDGCEMRCGFCVIPTTRGRHRSRSLPEVIEEVSRLCRAGYQEVVVTGVQISAYRWHDHTLFELIQAILADTTVPRVRLTSIAPWSFDARLLDVFSSPRVCRHVHLSLQSGCSATLARMRRPYDAAGFQSLLGRVRAAVPGAAVTTDVIVGFPGETEEDFEESLQFTRRASFARVHAFPYSVRPATEAADLPDRITEPIKRHRMGRMLEVARRSRERFEQSLCGTEARVLWEHRKGGRWHGLTDNYARVICDSRADLEHRITKVRLIAATPSGLTCAPPKSDAEGADRRGPSLAH